MIDLLLLIIKRQQKFYILIKHKLSIIKKTVSEIFNIKNVDGYLVYLKEDSIEFF